MNRGRGRQRGGGGGGGGRSSPHPGRYNHHNYNNNQTHVGARPNDSSLVNERTGLETTSIDGITNQFHNTVFKLDYQYQPNSAAGNASQGVVGTSKQLDLPSDMTPVPKEPSPTDYSADCGSEKSGRTDGESEKSDGRQQGHSFDICQKSTGKVIKLKSSLLVKNRETRNEKKRLVEGSNIKILRPGMLLLKGYLSFVDQVKLVNLCRDLGRGLGGFYQPGYRDGANLHLKMMCLGKNWDPATSSYGDERPIDGTVPPPIPTEFQRLVKEAIQECHNYIQSRSKVNAKDTLPPMSPNICIVNFYTKTGKLGLHQDKDETRESLNKGLPVVSFSLGDSAEFLYGDQRDIDKVEKVVLESGDVLVFGGKSRHIFHGVSSIKPDTTSKALTEETGLIPGRLNLTFREY